jgi:predicted amidohydrolase
VHIGVLAVTGAGAAVAYRKVWLGGDETLRFTPGAGPVVLLVDGWRLGLAVCRDMGIAEHAAATASLGIDAYLAGTLEHADDRDEQERRARRVAVDHGVWVAVASFAGATGGGYHDALGCSAIWTPDGAVAARAGSGVGQMARAVLTRMRRL